MYRTDRVIFNYRSNQVVPEHIEPLVSYLDTSIPEDWEIYIEPFLNGLTPDILLMNSQRGIHIIECKPELDVSIRRLQDMVDEIKELYCPRIQVHSQKSKGKTSNIFTSYADLTSSWDELNNNLSGFNKLPPHFSILSKESLNQGFADSFKLMKDGQEFSFNPLYAEDLRSWLRPSEFTLDHNEAFPKLDKKQQDLALKVTPRLQRFTGSAGSGKTIVLASKAANLIADGKKVLFLTFNITLINYIRGLVFRNLATLLDGEIKKPIGSIEIRNYHRFAKHFLKTVKGHSGWGKAYDELWSEYEYQLVLNEKLPNLVTRCVKESTLHDAEMFDAVLIDEGQDFHPLWWENTKLFLRDVGQACFVFDFTQDLYRKKSLWPEQKFTGSGFPGGAVARLGISYRLPNLYLPKIKHFLKLFHSELDAEKLGINFPETNPQNNLFEGCNASWIQIDDEASNDQCVQALCDYTPLDSDSFSYSSLLFLAMTNECGLQICSALNARNISVTHTFGSKDDGLSRSQKTAFSLHKNHPIKATTIHSAKGLESSMLVLQIQPGAKISHVYTALTRLRMGANEQCSIIVVCSDPKYADYGKSW